LALTLEVVDSGDGSGAVATVTGSDPASMNTVSVQYEDGGGWDAAGSRMGDGTVSLSLGLGYYWAKVVSVLGAVQDVGNVVRFAATSGEESVHDQILEAVKATIPTISLPGFNPENVFKRMIPDDANAKFPGIFLTTEAPETIEVATNQRDDIGYPVVTYICDRNARNYSAALPKFLLWRQRVIGRFRTQRLPMVGEVFGCKVEPFTITDPKLPWYDYVVSAFILRFKARLPRGI
jgi:hypothetical protein